jgi:hypothetical protein
VPAKPTVTDNHCSVLEGITPPLDIMPEYTEEDKKPEVRRSNEEALSDSVE